MSEATFTEKELRLLQDLALEKGDLIAELHADPAREQKAAEKAGVPSWYMRAFNEKVISFRKTVVN